MTTIRVTTIITDTLDPSQAGRLRETISDALAAGPVRIDLSDMTVYDAEFWREAFRDTGWGALKRSTLSFTGTLEPAGQLIRELLHPSQPNPEQTETVINRRQPYRRGGQSSDDAAWLALYEKTRAAR